MSGFKQFHDEGDAENNGGGDNTTSFFNEARENVDSSEEFRNERLDSNFRKNPIPTWLKMMFPHFNLLSITTLYALLLIIFYILELLFYINNTWSCVTYSFGANYTPAIQRGHLQRLIFPAFLHNDFSHLLWNVFVLFAIGMNAEFYLGTVGYSALIGTSILLGNTFTAGFRSYVCGQSVGGSVVIMGIIAFEFVWCLFNFNKMNLSKWLYGLYFGTIFATTLMGTWVAGNIVEFWGHLGGFIAGLCITCFFYKEILKFTIMDKAKFACIAVVVICFLIGIIAVFRRNCQLCPANK